MCAAYFDSATMTTQTEKPLVASSVELGSFARQLEHLARNGYVTLSLDEYVAVLRGRLAPRAPAALW